MTGAGPGWLLPYLVIAVVVAIELAVDRLSVGGFVALAPLLASRLSSRRGQVVAAGVIALLVGFALGARAISGSERVRAQTEVLAQVQALLLTTPPSWAAGYQVGVRYQSASGLAQIGGDFYDVVEVDDLGLAFILADARGKGLEASSLAAVLKGAFRTLAGEAAGPARILHRLDRLVARRRSAAGPGWCRWPRRSASAPRPTRATGCCAGASGSSATPTAWSRPATPPGSSSTGPGSRRPPRPGR